jgi:signal transduction histidine kinase
LVQRLGTPLGRPVIAADENHDYSMWGRFIPNEHGTAIEITDWVAIARHPASGEAAVPDASDSMTAEWMWRCDAQLRLTALWPDMRHADLAIDTYLGGSITEIFSLLPDDFGRFPMLSAMASEQDFTQQSAELIARIPHSAHAPHYSLSGSSLRDDSGRFSGFTGRALDVSYPAQSPELPLEPPQNVTGPDPLNTMLPGLDFGKSVDASMRAPLGRIIANADSISARVDGPIRQDYANYARDIAMAGRHLMGLIDDLADVQAIERTNFSIASESVDLSDVVRRASGILSVKLREKNMILKLPLADDGIMAQGEFRRILQIMINLIGNASRYSPEGSEIWISTDENAERQVYVTVADQGNGIASEDQARIFEKFERLGRSDHGGSGLGLYISRRLARAMGGELSVESAPGQGARFTLTLPKAR